MADVRPVYELRRALTGATVFVVAPGPSLAEVPAEGLTGRLTVVLNSAVEIVPDPWVWMYADKRFSWLYRVLLRSPEAPRRVLVAKHQLGIRRYFKGEEIWFYEWQMPIRRYQKRVEPWWFYPKKNFLPGHGSVVTNALSFCTLLNAQRMVLMGVDFECRGDQYYVPGIERNKGPTGRDRALTCGLNWLKGGLYKKRFWDRQRVLTTSKVLAEKVQLPWISPEEALAL